MLQQEIEIIGYAGDAEVFRRHFAPGEYIIGREPGCSIELQINGISRQHARLVVTSDAVFIEDLGSTNGTFIDDQEVTERTPVSPDLWIKIGDALIQWRSVAAPVVQATIGPRPRKPMAPVPGAYLTSPAPTSSTVGPVLAVTALLVVGASFVMKQMMSPSVESPLRATTEAAESTNKKPAAIQPETAPQPTAVADANENPPTPIPEPVKITPAAEPVIIPEPVVATPVATKSADIYPGVPVLNLSPSVPVGDPDFVKLLAAAKWTCENGRWDRLQDDLENSLVVLAGSGSSIARPALIERMLEMRTLAAVFAQERFIRAIGAAMLGSICAEPERQEFILWLFAHPAILTTFDDTILPQDKPREVMQAWWEIWKSDKDGREPFSSLAIACALVFDEPVRINPAIFGTTTVSSALETSEKETEASALQHYRFFRDSSKRGVLRAPIAEMTPRDLVWVVDAPVPESELTWAQKHMSLSRSSWSKAYGMIRYRMDRATQGVNPYKAYTLAEILKEGGICGDQAYFAAITAKANGIPAMVISGVGDRGGHAWFGYKALRNEWNLTTGRYSDNYAAGSTTDPQTHETIKEHELKMFADPIRRTDGYAKSAQLVALAKVFVSAKRDDLASVTLDVALKITPKHLDAWFEKLAALRAAKIKAEDWQREIAKMRTTFHGWSDVIQQIDKIEAEYVSSQGDYETARKLVHRNTARMGIKDQERTDLILDGVFQETELAEASGDADKIGRIYREAMRTKGDEVVAFRKIAKRYYEWGKKSNKGPTSVRDIISTFEQKHKEPGGDVFAIGAYRGVLSELIAMVKEQGMTSQEHSLERRETKLKELQEKIGKEQSKNADR
ncbi:MAG: FHA domain-containing protein [Verrucomicrobia bacterium]|nr:FHA domain-containing protein [Verrucomicrobiota bacterium]